jgi:calcium-dependent protein kinase
MYTTYRKRSFSLNRSKSSVSKQSFVTDRVTDLLSLYTLDISLGAGSFGRVTRATNRKTGQMCAIKSIRYDNVGADRVQALFTEIEILRELVRTRQDHPYIIKIYQVIHEEAYIHIVTELCTGGELFDRLAIQGSFPEATAAEYTAQIMSALNYLHVNSIVHRDLKPENMLLTSSSPNSPLKLIDFGTSQICDPLKKLSQLAGTPYYIAPEIITGNYDEKCDIWSCGVILFMMLSGKPPFNGKSRDDLFRSIVLGKYSMDGPQWRSISPQAKALVRQLLTLDPTERPSAEGVLASPWVKCRSMTRDPMPQFALKSMKNIVKFKVRCTQQREGLRQAVMTYISSQMSNAEEDELRKLFTSFDQNGDGRLSREELIRGFAGTSMKIDVDVVLRQCDTDGDGFIGYTEFLNAANNWRAELSEARLRTVFNAFDEDGNGTISIDEFKAVVEDSDELWKKIIRRVDKNGDGEIDFDEFKQSLKRRVKRKKRSKLSLSVNRQRRPQITKSILSMA